MFLENYFGKLKTLALDRIEPTFFLTVFTVFAKRIHHNEISNHQRPKAYFPAVEAFGRLLKPMIATIDARGLKSHFLKKHKKTVKKFFDAHLRKEYLSELASKYQKRLRKNWGRLFTFLDHDGVPWNNNNAENAIKGFATLRRVMGGSSTEIGLRDYLKLLSIAQTLKNKNLSFLEFLKSGERNLSKYLQSKGSGLHTKL